jgi:hypothetical protein
MSLQETLLAGFKKSYPESIVKKIDKDNFLDIHISSISNAKATHLFFNTPKSGIKIGFYCRDENFIKKTLKKSKKLEGYSQGIRLTNNPVFETPELALKAALTLVELMTKEKVKKEVKPKAKPTIKVTPKLIAPPNFQIPLPSIQPKEGGYPQMDMEAQVSIGFWQKLWRIFFK